MDTDRGGERWDDEVERIARLLTGKYAMMNLIPYNAVVERGYRRPAWERAYAISRALHQRGIVVSLRNAVAQDIEEDCGQLRARVMERAAGE